MHKTVNTIEAKTIHLINPFPQCLKLICILKKLIDQQRKAYYVMINRTAIEFEVKINYPIHRTVLFIISLWVELNFSNEF